ncbi:prepilin-type N-terminal cleavage/methylation domain-containing protein [Burkholderia multivorans]|uniref:type IV pilus modification PilV family protein n=1 Tax=Burkholderia multivorans TaxID=87883 RepID=UPI0020184E3E|nr:prepilin-type N-terminal cleavage/methylation domain-containing protein [Burkholderia multivorans]UQN68729.1 prepilin-type N-terminal cleavage/methylation domain-containing protein [Burkholderia multivorans]UQN74457.1 prepilin-type N-terminal cleavage/methylation domain-containing protein [Burkholderia multivorans]
MIAARNRSRGKSLLEAMLAIALLAIVMLAVAGSQLAMARAQRAMVWRERALWLADARLEYRRAARGADGGVATLAAASLPGGSTAIESGPGGVQFAIVAWRGERTVAPSQAQCGNAVPSAQPPSCVRIPFREVDADER